MRGENGAQPVGGRRREAVAAKRSRKDKRHGAQAEFDTGIPANAAERRIGLRPADNRGLQCGKRALVRPERHRHRQDWKELQPVQVPDVFYIAQCSLVTIVYVEAINILSGPELAGHGVLAPKRWRKQIV
jgi:hypothetical protein